jgi:hypothetical protein
MRRPFVLAALLAAVLPSALAAQTVPLVTVDLTAGRGAHRESVGERWFLSGASSRAAQATLAVRLGGRGRVRPVAVLDYSFDVRPDDVSLLCVEAPNGSCRVSFPSTTGFGAGLGVRVAVTDRLLGGVSAGVGRYDGPTRFVGADLSARVLRRVGVVAALRHVVIDDPAWARTWFRPLTVGVRVQ